MIILLLLWLAAELVCGQVSLGFPFDQQLPSVARVNEPYSFTVAETTYISSDLTVVYSASSLPSWLLFDASSRTFTGTPSSSDAGLFQVTLSGTDALDGSTISNTYTLVVSTNPRIQLSSTDTVSSQLAAYGNTNGRGALVLTEGQQIDIRFNKDTFVPESEIVAYYGVSADRSPLPPWITFNSDDLSFTGTVPTVPSQNAPASSFGLSLVATDYRNYEGAEAIFNVIVGGHVLSTSINNITVVNGTMGSRFSIQVPVLTLVFLDQSPITSANISLVSAASSLPSYASFDTSSYVISGNFPSQNQSDLFNINVNDVYGNLVSYQYTLNSIGSLFTVTELGNVNATRDEYFQYQLGSSLFTSSDPLISVNTGNASWLTYNLDNMTFTGITPTDFTSASIGITVSSGDSSSTLPLSLRGVSRQVVTSSSSSSSSSQSSSTTSSSSATSSASEATATSLASAVPPLNPVSKGLLTRTKLAIGLGVGIPLFLIILALLIFFFCCFAKKRKSKDEEAETGVVAEKEANPLSSPELQGPGFGTFSPVGAGGPVAPNGPYGGVGGAGAAGALGAGALGAGAAAAAVARSTDPGSRTIDHTGNLSDTAVATSLDQLIPLKDDDWDADDAESKSDDHNSTSYSASTAHESMLDSNSSEKEVPVISWRADIHDDENARLARYSVATMDTVNTDTLFLVRVVDEMVNRDSDIGNPMGSPLLSLVAPSNRNSDQLNLENPLNPLIEESHSEESDTHLPFKDAVPPSESDPNLQMYNSSDHSSQNLLSRISISRLHSALSGENEVIPPRSIHRGTPTQSSPTSNEYTRLGASSQDQLLGPSAFGSSNPQLVDFTRGGSLRQVSHHTPQFVNQEHTAKVDEDADSL